MMKKQDELFRIVEYSADAAERIGYSNYSYWRSVWQNFLKKKSAVVMALVFIALVVFSFIALGIGKYQYSELMSDNALAFTNPNGEYWFGTDNLGRDYWCQVWYAAQTSIKLALIVAIGECIIGVIIGCLWGYVRSLDGFLTELYNLVNNVPMVIYMTLIALVVGQSFRIMATSMIAIGWLVMARNVRNLVIVIILRLALSIPATIALESTLSYLGLGLDINTPSLGLLLRNAREYFLKYPYLLIFPAVIVSLITVTFYLVGNAFSDAADPRNHV